MDYHSEVLFENGFFVLFWMAHGDHNAIKVNVFHQGTIDGIE